LLPKQKQPFVFPSQIVHVFFSNSTHALSWKVILSKGTRFRHVVGDQYEMDALDPSNNALNFNANPYLCAYSGPPLQLDNDIQDHDDGWCFHVLYMFQIIHCFGF
jgi:hypothetical protein